MRGTERKTPVSQPTTKASPRTELLTRGRTLLHVAAVRSALRFALTILVVDVIVIAMFGSTTAAVLGSFAVTIQLYFLDYDGNFRERLIGHGVASLVGVVAVGIGVGVAGPLLLAVVATFLVSGTFAYLRVLRGYIARSAVGLQGAFFLPIMASVTFGDAPTLVAGWLVGCIAAILAALFVVPHQRSGVVRALLANWLRSASDVSLAVAHGADVAPRISELGAQRDALLAQMTGSTSQPGAVSHRQRAVASMMAAARWSMPLAEQLAISHASDPSTLARESADAFEVAARLVDGGPLPAEGDIPDLRGARTRDLTLMADQPLEVVREHYPVRLLSIGAMNQLFRAAESRGVRAPEPDLGQIPSQRPFQLLRENFRWNSLWLHNAIRTGAGAAACVWLVRSIGLEHGVWVVLAALSVTQVSLSGLAGTRTMARIVVGAIAGVFIAGLFALLHLPALAYFVALPVAAFVAKRVADTNMVYAQMAYTPFALINVAVLTWPPDKGIELIRVEDILLGAAVAAVFSILVFPTGVAKLLRVLQTQTTAAATTYLRSQIAALNGSVEPAVTARAQLVRDIASYESALDAAYMSTRSASAVLADHERAAARAHDLLIGGDACAQVRTFAQQNPRLEPVAADLAQWWGRFLAVT